jgi:hypothetical protein
MLPLRNKAQYNEPPSLNSLKLPLNRLSRTFFAALSFITLFSIQSLILSILISLRPTPLF